MFRKFKHLTQHSEYNNAQIQSHNYLKLSNPKENLAYKKKVEKQIIKRQKNKKTNKIKLPNLKPLLLNQSTANILVLDDSLFNSNINLNNPINSFSKQILLQQQNNQVIFFLKKNG